MGVNWKSVCARCRNLCFSLKCSTSEERSIRLFCGKPDACEDALRKKKHLCPYGHDDFGMPQIGILTEEPDRIIGYKFIDIRLSAGSISTIDLAPAFEPVLGGVVSPSGLKVAS